MDMRRPRGIRAAKPTRGAHDRPASDCVLLRLRPGDAARLDAACRAAGFNRSRFCRERMIDLLAAIGPRLAAIEEAGGIEAVLSRGLAETADVAAEFDALFDAH
jgi:hypothetical protein